MSSGITPAAQSAAYSPELWPAAISGVTPSARRILNMPISVTPSEGCAMFVTVISVIRFSSSSFVKRGGGKMYSLRRFGRRFSSTRSAARKPSCSSVKRIVRSRIMSGRCEPWPGNTNAIFPSRRIGAPEK